MHRSPRPVARGGVEVHKNRRKGRRLVVPVIVAGALAAAGTAYAASINNTDLTGGGNTTWDPFNGTSACTDLGVPAFTPVSDGSTTSPSRSDAFDDALILFIKKIGVLDLDGNGKKHNQ